MSLKSVIIREAISEISCELLSFGVKFDFWDYRWMSVGKLIIMGFHQVALHYSGILSIVNFMVKYRYNPYHKNSSWHTRAPYTND